MKKKKEIVPDKLDIREEDELLAAFDLADKIVTKNYLGKLEELKIKTPDHAITQKPVSEQASLFRIKKIVYEKQQNNLQKLINTYASTIGTKSGIVMIIKSDGNEVELYLGTTGADNLSDARSATSSLYNNFMSNFPGSSTGGKDSMLDTSPMETLIKDVTNSKRTSISCVSTVGSSRDDEALSNENFYQGIEKMIDSMRGIPFAAIFIADAVSSEKLADIKAEYEIIYSQLAPFSKSELSFNESSADGVTKTLTKSLTTTLTKNKSNALSLGSNESKAHTEGESKTHTDTVGVHAGVTVGIAEFVGVNAGANYSHSFARSKNWSDTTTFGTTKSQTKTIGEAEAKGEIESNSNGTTETQTTGRSLSITYENKTVRQHLDLIDEQLERINDGENLGMFATSAYFLASTPIYSMMAASAYKGLVGGKSTHVEASRINTWFDEKSVKTIKQYLSVLHHPEFVLDELNVVTPATAISSKELALQLGVPYHSVNGITVVESAAFGRNVPCEASASRYVNIGNLYHMGRDEKGVSGAIPVNLDIESLSMHTFITGSTGSGKSNAIYTLLEKILDRNSYSDEQVSFMVIEPAKGEYKTVFGNRKDVRVLGTNAKCFELLKINPFSFPDEIHVLEHIDRLIEIFNVCWPMYAAMPAILKDSVERAYINAGWDLEASECAYSDDNGTPIYPTFVDILKQIEVILKESSYSADSKGDYTGALSTRIKSLTNGIYKQIFSSSELSPKELFDKNVIIDLSRVGSVETKSLLMGIMILKMQEYRMSRATTGNSRLKHITVLEEAHNLLKKTSSDQSAETSNLLGKSVEMLANSIAEMRTYGEGFVIADQSPGLLDMSVIRNTNTKIILRLPDQSDRELVGKSASLNDAQITELSKFSRGVAAVYQNEWIEPVLCHIHRCTLEESPYIYDKSDSVGTASEETSEILELLMMSNNKKLGLDSNIIKKLEQSVYKINASAVTKVNLLRYLKESDSEKLMNLRCRIIYDLFNSETAISLAGISRNDMAIWHEQMTDKLKPDISDLDYAEQQRILAIIIKEHAERTAKSEDTELVENYVEFVNRRIGV